MWCVCVWCMYTRTCVSKLLIFDSETFFVSLISKCVHQRRISDQLLMLCLRPDGKQLASSDKTVCLNFQNINTSSIEKNGFRINRTKLCFLRAFQILLLSLSVFTFEKFVWVEMTNLNCEK